MLATIWREFENNFGSPAAFALLPREEQSHYLNHLIRVTNVRHDLVEKLGTNSEHETNALCDWAATRLFSIYIVALSERDHELEAELAEPLDAYLLHGYQISWRSCPVKGDDKRPTQAEIGPLMARQSWRERRGDQDEKRQPYQIMIAPSPHQRKPVLIVPPCDCRGAAISSRRIGCRQRPLSV